MAEWISRFPYGFYSYSSQQTKQLKDFLGIDPPGVTIDFYLASRSQEQLEKWRDYWLEVWTDLQRCDLCQFTLNQYTKYSKKKPEEESSSVKEGYYIHKDKCEYTTKAGKIEYTSKSKCEKALKKMREKEEEEEKKEEEKKKEEEVPQDFLNDWSGFERAVKNNDWTGVKNFIFGNPDMKLIAGTVPIGPAGLAGGAQAAAKLGPRAFSIAKFLQSKWVWITAIGVGILKELSGQAFQNEWFGKEGLIESVSFPLGQQMSAYRYKADPETLKLIKSYYSQLGPNIKRAKWIINTWGWLWPFTKGNWNMAIQNYELDYKNKGEEIAKWEKATEKKLYPEVMTGYVRNIIDGDTIDLGMGIKNANTGEEVVLPEYAKTTHVRIRIAGINTPEKSPKGEIVCTGIDLYKVEGKYADDARTRLLPLNDKEVILKIDKNDIMDTYGRVVGVIEYNNEDIGLRQIKEGLACYYSRGTHKWVNDDVYKNACETARRNKVGFWATAMTEEEKEKAVKINFTSDPSNAELWIDGKYTYHRTPSNEIELSDVKSLISVGNHDIEMIKGNTSAKAIIDITEGENGEVHLVLKDTGLIEEPKEEEEKEEVPEEEEVTPEKEVRPDNEVDAGRIPAEYTTEQAWALKEYFGKIWDLMGGKNVMSEKERIALKNSYTLYTADQKIVLDLLMEDIAYYEWGKDQLSNDEFKALCLKYRINDEWSVK